MSTWLLRIGVTLGAIGALVLGTGCLAETTESEETLDTAEQDLGTTEAVDPPEESVGVAVPGVQEQEPDPEPFQRGRHATPGGGQNDGEGKGD